MRPLPFTLLFLFVVFLLVSLMIVAGTSHGQGMTHAEFMLGWFTRSIGLFIATAAALALLLSAFGKSVDGERAAVLAVASLLGLLMIAPQWGVGLAAGAVGVAIVVRRHLGLPESPGPGDRR